MSNGLGRWTEVGCIVKELNAKTYFSASSSPMEPHGRQRIKDRFLVSIVAASAALIFHPSTFYIIIAPEPENHFLLFFDLGEHGILTLPVKEDEQE